MYIDIVPNRTSPPAVLLRESWREGGRIRKRTLANLSSLPMEQVEALRRVLRGEKLVPAGAFKVVDSRHHGHVAAVRTAMKKLGIGKLLGYRRSRERDLVEAMIAARVLRPDSKLATTRWWRTTTLPDLLGVSDADEDDLYAAMDWLLARQAKVEKKLASRHLGENGLVLYDLSSSYFEGKTCPLAARGHNRDKKKGKLQVNYGLLTTEEGCPVSISVFPGNTGDPTTLPPQVQKVREEFGLHEVVLVGDRGMVTQKQIDELRPIEGVRWLTALRPNGLRKLLRDGTIQLDLFDERSLFELTHDDYPGERLVACRNPSLAKARALKRKDLLQATADELSKIRVRVRAGRLGGKDQIALRVGKVINRYRVAKHFDLEFADDRFEFSINEQRVADEAALDGIYVIRTSVPAQRMDADSAVRGYKQLCRVERAFRTLKSIDIRIRPIRHRLARRVRAHIFLAMLAYYVRWHMEEAWRALLFADEDQEARATRDPVAPATRSPEALAKCALKKLPNGDEVHSFRTLLDALSTVVRNTCVAPGDAPHQDNTFDVDTTPDQAQQRAYDLLQTIAT